MQLILSGQGLSYVFDFYATKLAKEESKLIKEKVGHLITPEDIT